MTERSGAVTFQGDPLTLTGEEVQVGDKAPEFSALRTDLSEFRLSELAGKVVILCSVPSLDTSVCDTEIRRFNEEAAALDDDVKILTVSMDLPFAQERWCGAADIDQVIPLSDHRDAWFANAYGLLIKELRLLARAVIVVDREGNVKYREIVKEITNEPDYNAAIDAARSAL